MGGLGNVTTKSGFGRICLQRLLLLLLLLSKRVIIVKAANGRVLELRLLAGLRVEWLLINEPCLLKACLLRVLKILSLGLRLRSHWLLTVFNRLKEIDQIWSWSFHN